MTKERGEARQAREERFRRAPLSECITMALEDLERVEADPLYEVRMGTT